MWSKPLPQKIQDYLLRSSLKVKFLQISTKKLFKVAGTKFILKKAIFLQVVPEFVKMNLLHVKKKVTFGYVNIHLK